MTHTRSDLSVSHTHTSHKVHFLVWSWGGGLLLPTHPRLVTFNITYKKVIQVNTFFP